MHYIVQHGDLKTLKSNCVIIGLFEDKSMTSSAQQIDSLTKGAISQILKQGDFSGKLAQTLMLYHLPDFTLGRVLLVGCGKKTDINDQAFRKIICRSIASLAGTGVTAAACCLNELSVKSRDDYWKIRQLVELCEDQRYSFDALKTKREPSPYALSSLTFLTESKEAQNSLEKAVIEANAISAGKKLSRDLANLPANICTPTYLAEQAQALAKKYKTIRTSVYDESDIKKWGMGALLSVAKGSEQAPRLVTMEYQGSNKNQAAIVLVGKGITFDSGGISIKPGPGMDEMKYDMCGAASVIATLQVIAELKLPLSVVGLFAAAENLPSGRASKPGDIVTTLSGQTVEILNTDAEGRLILCDALTFSERFNPEIVIDVATLTGNIVLALGPHASGVFSNDDELTNALISAGNYSVDRLWRMPLWEEYQETLSSNFADMANIGVREAGSIIAACYLSRFTYKFRWAHIDIAGTAWKSGKEKGATGRPVSLLTQFLLNKVAH